MEDIKDINSDADLGKFISAMLCGATERIGELTVDGDPMEDRARIGVLSVMGLCIHKVARKIVASTIENQPEDERLRIEAGLNTEEQRFADYFMERVLVQSMLANDLSDEAREKIHEQLDHILDTLKKKDEGE